MIYYSSSLIRPNLTTGCCRLWLDLGLVVVLVACVVTRGTLETTAKLGLGCLHPGHVRSIEVVCVQGTGKAIAEGDAPGVILDAVFR